MTLTVPIRQEGSVRLGDECASFDLTRLCFLPFATTMSDCVAIVSPTPRVTVVPMMHVPALVAPPPVPVSLIPPAMGGTNRRCRQPIAGSNRRASSLFVDAMGQLTRQLDDCMSQATRKENSYPVRVQASFGDDDLKSQSGARVNRPPRT